MANFGLSITDGDLKYTAPDGTVIDVAEGTGSLFVKFTADGANITASCPSKDIYDAFTAGKGVVAILEDSGSFDAYEIMSAFEGDDDEYGALFQKLYFEDFENSSLKASMIIYAGNEVTYLSNYYDLSSLIDT